MILFLMIYDGGRVQLWQSHITLKVIRILFVSQVMPSKRDADFSRDVHKAVRQGWGKAWDRKLEAEARQQQGNMGMVEP